MIESQGKRRRHRSRWIIFLIFAAVLGASQWLGPCERVARKDDLVAAQAEARAVRKPVLAYFTADWCGPCRNMKRSVWSDRQVANAARAYVPVRIDIDRWPEIAQRYQVRSIPLVAVLDEQGRVLRSIAGTRDAAEMIQWLTRGVD